MCKDKKLHEINMTVVILKFSPSADAFVVAWQYYLQIIAHIFAKNTQTKLEMATSTITKCK